MAWRRPTGPCEDEAPTAQIRAIHALEQARKARHHRTCRCMQFEKLWCNPTDKLWCLAIDRELDIIPRKTEGN